jgi:hypothetical protein
MSSRCAVPHHQKYSCRIFFFKFLKIFFQSSVDWPWVNEELHRIQISCGRPSVKGGDRKGSGAREQREKLSVGKVKKTPRDNQQQGGSDGFSRRFWKSLAEVQTGLSRGAERRQDLTHHQIYVRQL